MTRDYSHLPMRPEQAEIDAFVEEILSEPGTVCERANALWEMAERQGMRPFSSHTASRIRAWAIESWTESMTDVVCFEIVGGLLVNVVPEESDRVAAKALVRRAAVSVDPRIRECALDLLRELNEQ